MRKSPSQAAHQTPGMEQQFWAVVESQMIPVIYSHQEIYRQLMLLKWRKGLVKGKITVFLFLFQWCLQSTIYFPLWCVKLLTIGL
jgi:hypothetical protein